MYKAYKFRIIPNNDQKVLLNKSFGCARFVYNYYLDLSTKTSYKNDTFYEFIRQLQYKSKFKGKYFYQIDTYYPSIQTCSVCSHIDKKYKNLNERMYCCNNHHNELDRDLNASINIMFEGLKLHMKYNFNIKERVIYNEKNKSNYNSGQ